MTFLLVVVGVVVRSTGSGLGCPEWPTCHGSWVPPFDNPHAIIEWSHRTTAAIVGILALGLFPRLVFGVTNEAQGEGIGKKLMRDLKRSHGRVLAKRWFLKKASAVDWTLPVTIRLLPATN